MVTAVMDGGLTMVDEKFFDFPVMGCSGVVVISESHLSIHTWPQDGYAAADIFTCSQNSDQPPCGPWGNSSHSMQYQGSKTWICADGSKANMSSPTGIWAAMATLVAQVKATTAMLTWIERG